MHAPLHFLAASLAGLFVLAGCANKEQFVARLPDGSIDVTNMAWNKDAIGPNMGAVKNFHCVVIDWEFSEEDPRRYRCDSTRQNDFAGSGPLDTFADAAVTAGGFVLGSALLRPPKYTSSTNITQGGAIAEASPNANGGSATASPIAQGGDASSNALATGGSSHATASSDPNVVASGGSATASPHVIAEGGKGGQGGDGGNGYGGKATAWQNQEQQQKASGGSGYGGQAINKNRIDTSVEAYAKNRNENHIKNLPRAKHGRQW